MGLLDQVLGQVLGGAMGGRGGGPLAPTRGGGMGGGLGGGFGGGLGGGGLPGGLGGLLSGAKGPIAMAILAMLANKHLGSGAGGYGSALRDMMGGGRADPDGGRMGQTGGGGGILDQLGGLLGGGGQSPMSSGHATGGGLGGGLGGALGGGMLGGALGSGLSDLLGRFSQAGHGDAVESWVGSGPNHALSPHDLERAIGPEEIDELSRQTGMDRDEFLAEMSDTLPKVVDGLTPHGRLPTKDETTQWI